MLPDAFRRTANNTPKALIGKACSYSSRAIAYFGFLLWSCPCNSSPSLVYSVGLSSRHLIASFGRFPFCLISFCMAYLIFRAWSRPPPFRQRHLALLNPTSIRLLCVDFATHTFAQPHHITLTVYHHCPCLEQGAAVRADKQPNDP